MINTELEEHFSLFSNKQGSGYIFENDTDILKYTIPATVVVGTETINPGDMTALDNYLTGKVKYIGLVNERGMIFYYGKDNNLFPKYYYGLIFLMTSTRIFEMYGPNFGRDHNFINGKWK